MMLMGAVALMGADALPPALVELQCAHLSAMNFSPTSCSLNPALLILLPDVTNSAGLPIHTMKCTQQPLQPRRRRSLMEVAVEIDFPHCERERRETAPPNQSVLCLRRM